MRTKKRKLPAHVQEYIDGIDGDYAHQAIKCALDVEMYGDSSDTEADLAMRVAERLRRYAHDLMAYAEGIDRRAK